MPARSPARSATPACTLNPPTSALHGLFFGTRNPHLHTIAVDGVFEKTVHGVRFHHAPPPSKDDVGAVAKRVRDRSASWLRRHRYLDERAAEELRNEAAEPSAIDGCMQLALAGGAFLARPPPSPNETK